jgi:hypothetical protein
MRNIFNKMEQPPSSEKIVAEEYQLTPKHWEFINKYPDKVSAVQGENQIY